MAHFLLVLFLECRSEPCEDLKGRVRWRGRGREKPTPKGIEHLALKYMEDSRVWGAEGGVVVL